MACDVEAERALVWLKGRLPVAQYTWKRENRTEMWVKLCFVICGEFVLLIITR